MIVTDLAIFSTIAIVAGFLFFRRRRHLRIARPKEPIETTAELIPESKFIEFDLPGDGRSANRRTRLHYVQAGQGPDIVLLHGIGASVFIWRFLFPLLQTKYRVTAFDFPGFGQSCKEKDRDYGLDAQACTMATALASLGIKQPRLVGSSMGGAIALWMAKLYPDRFPVVAALAPATDSASISQFTRHLGVATPLLQLILNKSTMRRIVRRVVARQSLVTDEVVEAYLQPFMNDGGLGLRAFWAATSVLSDRRLPRELAGLKSRILLICGTQDLLVNARSIHRLKDLLPEAELIINEHVGHHMMEDDPAWTAKVLIKFFA